MALPILSHKGKDLWKLAATSLCEEDKQRINFGNAHRLSVLTDLYVLTKESKEKCIAGKWKYTRKSGEAVILRDVFDKIVKWIDIFKQVGDAAVQYDPVHAALPWAGVRFVLQVGSPD